MSGNAFGLSNERLRLSRRLLLRAVLGLLVVSGLCFAFALLWLAGLVLAFQSLQQANWVALAAALLMSGGAAWTAVQCLGWLYAPAGEPHGIALSRDMAMRLYALTERMRERVGGARVDVIWVTGDMNAAILQRPRWGLMGRMETHLLIGLPLMHSITERQFIAILAHEYGHLVCQRRGIAAWDNYLRSWWYRVVDRCLDDLPALSCAPMVERWSAADLAAASCLSRLEELEADEVAARCVGPALVGETLVEVALKERFLINDFWNKVMAQSELRPRPSIRPYRDLGLGVMAGFRRPTAWRDFPMSIFEDEESELDLHPSLVERLNALGTPPVGGCVEGHSAASRYLTPLLPYLAWTFDRAWWADTRNTWRDCYKCARQTPVDEDQTRPPTTTA